MDVQKVANLANLPLTAEEEEKIAPQLTDSLKLVDQINSLDTRDVKVTTQITSSVNVWREDVVDQTRLLKYNRYFKVPAIFTK
jgi:aspartyl-tRNA(Asn)/glutamyl-tRNA(Gln) amidotransferase subunit C